MTSMDIVINVIRLPCTFDQFNRCSTSRLYHTDLAFQKFFFFFFNEFLSFISAQSKLEGPDHCARVITHCNFYILDFFFSRSQEDSKG